MPPPIEAIPPVVESAPPAEPDRASSKPTEAADNQKPPEPPLTAPKRKWGSLFQ
jgi:hypothetical protein